MPDIVAWAQDPVFVGPTPLAYPVSDLTAQATAVGLANASDLYVLAGPCEPSFQGGPGPAVYEGDCAARWLGTPTTLAPMACPDTVVRVEGGACAHVGSASAWSIWLTGVLLLLRRALVAWAIAVGFLTAIPARAADVGLEPSLDPGSFHLLDPGPTYVPWTLHLRTGVDWRAKPVQVVLPDGSRQPLLRGVGSGRLAVGFDLFRYARITLGLPIRGTLPDIGANAVPDALVPPTIATGDVSLQATGVLVAKQSTGSTLHALVRLDVPTMPEAAWISGRSLRLGLMYGQQIGPIHGDAQLGVLTARPDAPTALTWGLGATWQHQWVELSLEAAGHIGFEPSVGVGTQTVAGPWSPVQGGVGARFKVSPGVWLQGYGGAGFNRGLGAPTWEAAFAVHVSGHEPEDIDGDGVVNLRDRCPRRAEDADGFQDEDGCPDEDNDQDGLVDGQDRCPNAPEDVDGHDDEDGCPERRILLVVDIAPEQPERVQAVEIGIDGVPKVRLIDERTASIELTGGPHRLEVRATDHLPWTTDLVMPDGDPTLDVTLHAEAEPRLAQFGEVRLYVQDTSGTPLAGWVVAGDGASTTVPVAGLTVVVASGAQEVSVGAPSFAPRTIPLDVPAQGHIEATVQLEPALAWLDNQRVVVPQQLRFDLNRVQPTETSLPTIDAIAALLTRRSDIALLRIEGHADASGSSRHNYELSVRRAQAIEAALVARGIEPERLTAIGSGEASGSDEAQRAVRFTVLIWDDPTTESSTP